MNAKEECEIGGNGCGFCMCLFGFHKQNPLQKDCIADSGDEWVVPVAVSVSCVVVFGAIAGVGIFIFRIINKSRELPQIPPPLPSELWGHNSEGNERSMPIIRPSDPETPLPEPFRL